MRALRTLKHLDIENIVACGTAGAADYISEGTAALEALKAAMEDDGAVEKLYRAMDVSGVEELLQKVMLYADLEGRVSGNG